MTHIILTIIAIVFGAALCACLEAAFFSVTLTTARIAKEEKKRGGSALLKIKERVHRSIVTLVILNNAVTIIGSIYVGHLTTELYGNTLIGIVSAVLTTVIILFGEIVPKILGENYAKSITLTSAPIVLLITQIFTPVVFIIEFLTKGLLKAKPAVSEEELRMLSQIGEAEGSIAHSEGELIKRVFTLNDLSAKDIMTPRTVLEALPAEATIREVAVIMLNKPYSRYPVFKETLDTIVGICQTKDILTALARDNDNELISHFMSTPLFVSEKKRVDELMALFLTHRSHMAVVQDEFGGTTGVVTFEDVLEQLVGEIVDETDEVVDLRSHARDQHTEKWK